GVAAGAQVIVDFLAVGGTAVGDLGGGSLGSGVGGSLHGGAAGIARVDGARRGDPLGYLRRLVGVGLPGLMVVDGQGGQHQDHGQHRQAADRQRKLAQEALVGLANGTAHARTPVSGRAGPPDCLYCHAGLAKSSQGAGSNASMDPCPCHWLPDRAGARRRPVRYYKRSVRQVSGLSLVCVGGAGREHCVVNPVWVASGAKPCHRSWPTPVNRHCSKVFECPYASTMRARSLVWSGWKQSDRSPQVGRRVRMPFERRVQSRSFACRVFGRSRWSYWPWSYWPSSASACCT